jgi:hypothetical protein
VSKFEGSPDAPPEFVLLDFGSSRRECADVYIGALRTTRARHDQQRVARQVCVLVPVLPYLLIAESASSATGK